METRPVRRITPSTPTMEGAGVRLRRGFGFGNTADFDPFLLFDDFRGEAPADYQAGFPWHPHRGIVTITYMLAGTVEHGDSLGNRGSLSPGEVQWMTAGSGIIHQEMPRGDAGGRMHGFQLWANLPAALKMTAPRYQQAGAGQIPEVVAADGTKVRVVCGVYAGQSGPVDGVAAAPHYLDIEIPPEQHHSFAVAAPRQAFAYVYAGSGHFGGSPADQRTGPATSQATRPFAAAAADPAAVVAGNRETAGNRSLVLFGEGDQVVVQAGAEGVRFVLVSGEPLREPVAWRGPIVMNTEAELRQAYAELREGTFVKASA